MHINRKFVLCLVLLCVFVCCLGAVSASDISVSSVNSDIAYNSSGYVDGAIVDGSINDTCSVNGDHKSSKYGGHISNGTNCINSNTNIDYVSSISVQPLTDNYTASSNLVFNKSYSNESINLDGEMSFDYICNVSSEEDFKNFTNYLKTSNKTIYCPCLEIMKNITITKKDTILDFKSTQLLTIHGNSNTISFNGAGDNIDNSHFLINNGDIFIDDLNINNFPCAPIINKGYMMLNNVNFTKNINIHTRSIGFLDKNYTFGGAIKNFGYMSCYECSFIGNQAGCGGAIYSEGITSKCKLINCYFKDNSEDRAWAFFNAVNRLAGWLNMNALPYVEKGGCDIFIADNGLLESVYLGKNNITGFTPTPNENLDIGYYYKDEAILVFRNSSLVIKQYNVTDLDSFRKVQNDILNSGTSVDKFIINITKDIKLNGNFGLQSQYGHIIINGNNHTLDYVLPVNDAYRKAQDVKLITLDINCLCEINNLKIGDLNAPIRINGGSVTLNNVTLENNYLDNLFGGENSGCIVNYGNLICNNCTFISNHGKLGSCIYCAHGGMATLENCTFINNTYDNGNLLYSFDGGQYIIINCTFLGEKPVEVQAYMNGNFINPINGSIIDNINDSSFVYYEKAPTGVKKWIYDNIDAICYATSLIMGFVTGGLGTALMGSIEFGQISGFIALCLGTTIGLFHAGYQMYYSYLIHRFTFQPLMALPIYMISEIGNVQMGLELGRTLTTFIRNTWARFNPLSSRIDKIEPVHRLGDINENFEGTEAPAKRIVIREQNSDGTVTIKNSYDVKENGVNEVSKILDREKRWTEYFVSYEEEITINGYTFTREVWTKFEPKEYTAAVMKKIGAKLTSANDPVDQEVVRIKINSDKEFMRDSHVDYIDIKMNQLPEFIHYANKYFPSNVHFETIGARDYLRLAGIEGRVVEDFAEVGSAVLMNLTRPTVDGEVTEHIRLAPEDAEPFRNYIRSRGIQGLRVNDPTWNEMLKRSDIIIHTDPYSLSDNEIVIGVSERTGVENRLIRTTAIVRVQDINRFREIMKGFPNVIVEAPTVREILKLSNIQEVLPTDLNIHFSLNINSHRYNVYLDPEDALKFRTFVENSYPIEQVKINPLSAEELIKYSKIDGRVLPSIDPDLYEYVSKKYNVPIDVLPSLADLYPTEVNVVLKVTYDNWESSSKRIIACSSKEEAEKFISYIRQYLPHHSDVQLCAFKMEDLLEKGVVEGTLVKNYLDPIEEGFTRIIFRERFGGDHSVNLGPKYIDVKSEDTSKFRLRINKYSSGNIILYDPTIDEIAALAKVNIQHVSENSNIPNDHTRLTIITNGKIYYVSLTPKDALKFRNTIITDLYDCRYNIHVDSPSLDEISKCSRVNFKIVDKSTPLDLLDVRMHIKINNEIYSLDVRQFDVEKFRTFINKYNKLYCSSTHIYGTTLDEMNKLDSGSDLMHKFLKVMPVGTDGVHYDAFCYEFDTFSTVYDKRIVVLQQKDDGSFDKAVLDLSLKRYNVLFKKMLDEPYIIHRTIKIVTIDNIFVNLEVFEVRSCYQRITEQLLNEASKFILCAKEQEVKGTELSANEINHLNQEITELKELIKDEKLMEIFKPVLRTQNLEVQNMRFAIKIQKENGYITDYFDVTEENAEYLRKFLFNRIVGSNSYLMYTGYEFIFTENGERIPVAVWTKNIDSTDYNVYPLLDDFDKVIPSQPGSFYDLTSDELAQLNMGDDLNPYTRMHYVDGYKEIAEQMYRNADLESTDLHHIKSPELGVELIPNEGSVDIRINRNIRSKAGVYILEYPPEFERFYYIERDHLSETKLLKRLESPTLAGSVNIGDRVRLRQDSLDLMNHIYFDTILCDFNTVTVYDEVGEEIMFFDKLDPCNVYNLIKEIRQNTFLKSKKISLKINENIPFKELLYDGPCSFDVLRDHLTFDDLYS